mmetsp:Transcript_27846/g.44304  ORF Transcript_27846/g.44304 Transcript_27846/m.44304 type:complete len:211 (-) Transcript_27846:485-1117(-)
MVSVCAVGMDRCSLWCLGLGLGLDLDLHRCSPPPKKASSFDPTLTDRKSPSRPNPPSGPKRSSQATSLCPWTSCRPTTSQNRDLRNPSIYPIAGRPAACSSIWQTLSNRPCMPSSTVESIGISENSPSSTSRSFHLTGLQSGVAWVRTAKRWLTSSSSSCLCCPRTNPTTSWELQIWNPWSLPWRSVVTPSTQLTPLDSLDTVVSSRLKG